MDIFTRFNRKSIDDRQIDTLIGISKGIVADGQVDHAEAEFLMSWLVQSREVSDNPVIANLLARVGAMLQDHVLDPRGVDRAFWAFFGASPAIHPILVSSLSRHRCP